MSGFHYYYSVTSGNYGTVDRNKILNAGMDGYITVMYGKVKFL